MTALGSAVVVALATIRRAKAEPAEDQRLRRAIEEELGRCRISAPRIAQAVAEGKRRLRMGWPHAQAAAHAVTWGLGSEAPK